MSTSTYTVEDLQRFDERCQEKAEKLGLKLPQVLFHLVQAEEMYDIHARHLPGRYSHYQFGRLYQQQKADYDRGRGRIYELVVNTEPVHAYLLDGNGLIAQLLVIAHVYGHAAVFENNAYFGPADKNILARVRANAERIEGYINEYGRTRVENFIDSCEALQYQRSFDILGKPRKPKEPTWEVKKFDHLFPEETLERRAEYLTERENYKHRFPKEPERDILAFIEKHARRLEDWQRDVISIIRSEMEYFAPQMRTQIVNEATAVYYHQTIVQELMAEDERFTTDDFTEFQSMNASVLAPRVRMILDEETGEPEVHCVGLNPYLTGTVIFNEIKRICEKPTDEEREQWPHWAGKMSWDEKRNEIIASYNDVALIAEFLSPKVCEKAKLFEVPRSRERYENLRVLKDEAKVVRDSIVEQKTYISPIIEIVDADYKNRGELYMVHRYDEIGLDWEYTNGTLPHVVELWGHPAVVKTLMPHDEEDNPDEERIPIWYRAHKSDSGRTITVDMEADEDDL